MLLVLVRQEILHGGFTFQFSDGWWKYGQTKNLDIHDNNASWSNGGYANDLSGTDNNMNEEGLVHLRKRSNSRGLYELYPRAAYYVLKQAHQVNPMQQELLLKTLTMLSIFSLQMQCFALRR
jgi:hypothetical protein